MKKNVFFYSNMIKLGGIISMPENIAEDEAVPAAVLSHGYGASRDEFGDFLILTEILNSMGIAVFRFDYRGCGRSDYPLGRMLCNDEWKDDLKNAISFVSKYTRVDKNKICLIGESMGASVSIMAASEDHRVKCIIALSPIADGYEWIKQNWTKNKSRKEFDSFLREVQEDKEREAIYGQSNLLKMADALAYEDRYLELIEEIHKNFDDSEFTYHIHYASIASILSMRPIEAVKKISPRPVLLLAGKKDGIVPWKMNSQKLYESVGEIKKLVIFDEGDHGLLAEPTKSETISEIKDWLNNYLINS